MNDLSAASVLLVEDNPINQQVAMELLTQIGISVHLAENGVAAVEMARTNRYDLILMDIQMPEMDGLEATRRIRKDGPPDLPIVAMTAHAMQSDREQSLAAGMNDHLNKPINPKKLEEVLRRWLPLDTPVKQPSLPERDCGSRCRH